MGYSKIGTAAPVLNWRIVGTADFTGDGTDDILWRNFTNGQDRIFKMSGGAYQSTFRHQF